MPPHDHDHAHDALPDNDGKLTYYEIMEVAVRELLIEKGVFTPADVRKQVEAIDSRTPALGSRVVAHAWLNPDFKSRLMADANAACQELGIRIGEANLVALENTPTVHNIIVCTLCSCYPRSVLGLPPDWYKSKAYRSRVIREPRSVLAEFGTELPENVAVRVFDSTAEKRFMVLPLKPPGTEGMTEAQLAALVTRDSMIGVALAAPPEGAHPA